VDLRQPAGRDQAFDRPDRHAEPLGGFRLGDQQPIRHATMMNPSVFIC
jgi:hypothetical protein